MAYERSIKTNYLAGSVHSNPVYLHEPLTVIIKGQGDSYVCELKELGISAEGDLVSSLEEIVNSLRVETLNSLGKIPHLMSQTDLDRKGLLLQYVDLHKSNIVNSSGYNWIFGDVEKRDDSFYFVSRDFESKVFDVSKVSDKSGYRALVCMDCTGKPVDPIFFLEQLPEPNMEEIEKRFPLDLEPE